MSNSRGRGYPSRRGSSPASGAYDLGYNGVEASPTSYLSSPSSSSSLSPPSHYANLDLYNSSTSISYNQDTSYALSPHSRPGSLRNPTDGVRRTAPSLSPSPIDLHQSSIYNLNILPSGSNLSSRGGYIGRGSSLSPPSPLSSLPSSRRILPPPTSLSRLSSTPSYSSESSYELGPTSLPPRPRPGGLNPLSSASRGGGLGRAGPPRLTTAGTEYLEQEISRRLEQLERNAQALMRVKGQLAARRAAGEFGNR